MTLCAKLRCMLSTFDKTFRLFEGVVVCLHLIFYIEHPLKIEKLSTDNLMETI